MDRRIAALSLSIALIIFGGPALANTEVQLINSSPLPAQVHVFFNTTPPICKDAVFPLVSRQTYTLQIKQLCYIRAVTVTLYGHPPVTAVGQSQRTPSGQYLIQEVGGKTTITGTFY